MQSRQQSFRRCNQLSRAEIEPTAGAFHTRDALAVQAIEAVLNCEARTICCQCRQFQCRPQLIQQTNFAIVVQLIAHDHGAQPQAQEFLHRESVLNTEFRLYYGPGYDWRAEVTRRVPGSEFELQMTDAQ